MTTALKVIQTAPTDSFLYERAFARNIGIFTPGEQESLASRRVAIPGCGGVGSLHALTLARMGIGRFHIADFDRFGIENINRQFGAKASSLGEKKATVIERELLDINPLADVKVFGEGIQLENLDAFLSGVDVVVDSLDFFAFDTREMLFTRARELGIPVVTAAPLGLSCALLVFTAGGMGFNEYFNFKPGDSFRSRCLKFFFGLAPRPTHMAYMDPGKIDFRNGGGPSSVIGIDLCAALAATEVMKLVLQRGKVLSAPHYRQFDSLTGTYRRGYLFFGNRSPLQKFKVWYADRFILQDKSAQTVAAADEQPEAADNKDKKVSTKASGQPSLTTLKNILTLASRAPTGDNCQPWRFRWDGNELRIGHDEGRGEHAFNCRNHASLFALGCLLESLEIAASKWGYAVTSVLPSDLTADPLNWATLRFISGREAPDETAAFLEYRTTDRQGYCGGSLDHWIFRHIESDMARFANAGLHWTPARNQTLSAYIAKAETYLWQNPAAHRDLFRWLRFSNSHTQQTQDGMPWQTLGLNYAESRMLKLAKSYRIQACLNRIGFLKNIEVMAARNIRSSAGLGLITVKDLGSANLVEAGRAAFRVWVQLNRAGYGVQPLSTSSLFSYAHSAGVMATDLPQGFPEHFAKGRQVLGENFGFGKDDLPFWLFRTGIAKVNGVKPKTLRLPVSQILTVV